MRGAATKLANDLGVSHVSVSRWFSGQLKPGEENVAKMAELLKVSEYEIKAARRVDYYRTDYRLLEPGR